MELRKPARDGEGALAGKLPEALSALSLKLQGRELFRKEERPWGAGLRAEEDGYWQPGPSMEGAGNKCSVLSFLLPSCPCTASHWLNPPGSRRAREPLGQGHPASLPHLQAQGAQGQV